LFNVFYLTLCDLGTNTIKQEQDNYCYLFTLASTNKAT